MMTQLILASASKHRAALLHNAGLVFNQMPSGLDERSIEAPLEEADVPPGDRAEILAEAKAVDVSESNPGTLVLGCDQILSLDDTVLHKVADMEAARRRLLALSGKTHFLHSSAVLVRDGQTLWRHVTPCAMTMRSLSPNYIGRYLAQTGQQVLSSVGAYQIEGQGVHLFSRIEGDFFSIVGLPMLPVLEALRQNEIIDG